MSRSFSPNGVPTDDVVRYYQRRAAAEVGLIITEGTWIPDPRASNDHKVPKFYSDEALAGWKRVLDAVHGAGGKIFPQLWHTGVTERADLDKIYDGEKVEQELMGPSGVLKAGEVVADPMTQKDIDDVSEAYVKAAVTAHELGFDGIELHGAHGYLIDQFFWDVTNLRTDAYGGSIAARSKFAADIITEIKKQTAPDFPISLRISQFKIIDYAAKLCQTPAEMEQMLTPLVDAGVDLFHCSQRRFWEAEFEGSPLNLAGWVKKISNVPTITVGSVGLDVDMMTALYENKSAKFSSLDGLLDRLSAGEFDLVAVGRAILSDPEWAAKVRQNKTNELIGYEPDHLTRLD